MPEKFGNKYRAESHRLKGWDYSSNGYYFITINTFEHECYFGEINNKKMILSEFGKIANDEWFKSFEIRQELFLDEFVIMPNHLHAIVVINKKHVRDDERMVTDESDNDDIGDVNGTDRRYTRPGFVRRNTRPGFVRRYTRPCVSTTPTPTLTSMSMSNKKTIPPQRKPKSISSFVAGYKSAVINKIDDWLDNYADTHGYMYQRYKGKTQPKFNRSNPLWQHNYHDHIIRNDKTYYKIKNYIKTNPEKWEDDKFNPNKK